MNRMNPERIGVRDFVKPFGIGAAGVNLCGEPEGGDQDRLIRCEIVGVYVALDIGRDGVFRPAPVSESLE